jgi:hypothetical protein
MLPTALVMAFSNYHSFTFLLLVLMHRLTP